MINKQAFDTLFDAAHTVNAFTDKAVGKDLLAKAYDHAKMAPTAFNCSPMRIVFVTSAAGKAKLNPLLMEGNQAKTMQAPVTAIIGYDLAFFNELPRLFPAYNAKPIFENNAALALSAANRNGTLQAGYFLLALRGLGLDVAAMSGFDNAGVDAAFFAGTSVQSNFLVNIGYGVKESAYPRSPRFGFDEIATFA